MNVVLFTKRFDPRSFKYLKAIQYWHARRHSFSRNEKEIIEKKRRVFSFEFKK